MKEYSFLDTVLLINGVRMTGFDEGDDVIALARTEDSFSSTVGVDGEMTVNRHATRRGTVTFRLMHTSNSNQYLSGLVAAAENGSFVPIFVQFKDVKGGDLGSGTQGYIIRPADMNRGNSVSNQEWVVTVERLDMLHTGA